MLPAFIKGYATTMGLIIAIGMQNAFILRQGLLKSHVLVIAILASLIDIVMIIVGVNGFGVVITRYDGLMSCIKYGSIIFLCLYGCRCFFFALFKTQTLNPLDTKQQKQSLKSAITTLLAVSFLNPHMYLDTVVLIGAVGASLAEYQRIHYIIGASLASITWFFCLSLGVRIFIPLFKKPIAWKILDIIIGIVMWLIAFSVWQEL